MAKVFQIVDNLCYWDASKKFASVEETFGKYPESVKFVSAPDYVFEGWGYIEGEFIQPTPPEGWLYDPETGTFYLENPPEDMKSDRELIEDLQAQMNALLGTEE